ncbi:spore protease YyaC [Virgibacillus sp. 179-BFC.A HS]|uniref:Spore protease YyaC n=1 Tax=Tigheibacillus jepli TaxID=3035914 RepID=A0ABU5CE86_9BACI|nr:spore protease YyaC [Virgibacillus sp. 179-BFC.A HS]MDY0404129.1 spore protease YyaC [Virgibacillus sp. 179-BFC.A HS]
MEKLISWMPTAPQDYVIACIGTDRSTGDALGPLTGTYLNEMKLRHISVYGTLDSPIHATNLQDRITQINQLHKRPYIIAIDACLGKKDSVGQLITGTGSIKPGAALNKPLPEIGNLHITGVVNIGGFMEHAVLQNTRLSLVVDMAKQIAMILQMLDQQMTYQTIAPAIVLRTRTRTTI